MTRGDGSVFSGGDLNKLLVPLSHGIVKPVGKKILSHYFREAIPTLMARAGYSDLDIMRQGRWRSTDFLAYCKLGRASRWKDQHTVVEILSVIFEKSHLFHGEFLAVKKSQSYNRCLTPDVCCLLSRSTKYDMQYNCTVYISQAYFQSTLSQPMSEFH